jgi:oxazoline/thiazoline dehydrogenase
LDIHLLFHSPAAAQAAAGPVRQRVTLVISLRPSVRLRRRGTRRHVALDGDRHPTLDDLPPGVRRAFCALADGWTSDARLERIVEQRDGPLGVCAWYYYLDRLDERGLLRYAIRDGRTTMARWTAVALPPRHARPLASGEGYVLSRFAYLRRDDAHLTLESPLSLARVELADPRAVTVVTRLTRPRTLSEINAAPDSFAAATEVIALLHRAGMLSVCASGCGDEEESDSLAEWDFADLQFHARSRLGRHEYPIGATFDGMGRRPPLPAVKRPMSDRRVSLEAPDLTRLSDTDVPFTRVLEERQSVRTYGDRPITAAQLGEFLFRVARVKDRMVGDLNGRPYEETRRPYPSGGACYPLELYPIVTRCDGLQPGLYHYDPADHTLERLSDLSAGVESLVGAATTATGAGSRPDVLIIVAARFGRVTWKYRSVAYATVLKDVGALLQTMYLVATAMGLAPCAIGAGDSETFARVTGLPFAEEGSVGEFALGSQPAAASRDRS